jgi:serine/threonine protein kinase
MGCPDPSQLQAFMDDPAGLEQAAALRAHFAGCPDCRALVLALAPEEPAHAQLPVTPEAPTVPGVPLGRHASVAAGERLGRYVVIGRIGEGGMGVVYTAHDPELDRKVAVKVLRLDSRRDEAALQRRLQREAQALARLSHPSVTAVYDVGTCAQGVFIAMEFVEGQTLAHWLERRHPWRAVVDMFVRAGRGLEAAHRAGLVHRDFKPDNVLVGNDGRVRVTDFGLARIESTEAPADPEASVSPLHLSITRSGVLMGTPAYMAPEQMSGEHADARCDIFSFCVALYEGLYRQRPFAGDNLPALRAAIARNGVREPPRSQVPERVRRALVRGLRARPDERHDEIGELLALLEREAQARRPSRWLTLGLPLLALVTAGVALPLVWSRAHAPGPAPSPPSLAPPAPAPAPSPPPQRLASAGPATVKLRITSTPPGAAVYRVSDGVELGTTPFEQTLAPVSGMMRFVLKLAGHADAPVVLPTDRDGERAVVLRKLARREARPRPPAPSDKSAPPVKVKLDDPFGD